MVAPIPISLPHRPAPLSLAERLSTVLPDQQTFHLYHLSTPPTKTESLCAAPPGERDDKTYNEKHFLAIAIDINALQSSLCPSQPDHDNECENGSSHEEKSKSQVFIMGIEIFIFTTAFNSIFFVSKADSTGYLRLLELPQGTPSPIRAIATAFLDHLLEARRRKNIQSVIALFARSQAQYLFPGSVENNKKHVLDDRSLVRWWCRVLDGVITKRNSQQQLKTGVAKGYLIVPGLDIHEMRAFIPRNPASWENWVLGQHPLKCISHYTREYNWVPPRCLIMRFPDDPKARFFDELDDEAHSSARTQTTGAWKSVRNLDQFWDMMAFRQECSSGQLTGFIWVVFDNVSPTSIASTASAQLQDINHGCIQASTTRAKQQQQQSTTSPKQPLASTPPPPNTFKQIAGTPVKTPRPSHLRASMPSSVSLSFSRSRNNRKSRRRCGNRNHLLRGPIVSRKPRVKTQTNAHLLHSVPAKTRYYDWSNAEGRGTRLVDAKGYEKVMGKLLLRLDFSSLSAATISTARWTREVGLGDLDLESNTHEGERPNSYRGWGVAVTGCQKIQVARTTTGPVEARVNENTLVAGIEGGANDLNGLVKRKRTETITSATATTTSEVVNVLGTGTIRKKQKADHTSSGSDTIVLAPVINYNP